MPIAKGVPALAVLDENGRLLYSAEDGRVRGDAADAVETDADLKPVEKPQRG